MRGYNDELIYFQLYHEEKEGGKSAARHQCYRVD